MLVIIFSDQFKLVGLGATIRSFAIGVSEYASSP